MPESSNVFLVGPMGSGKSAVGRQLARLMDLDFVDADAEIAGRAALLTWPDDCARPMTARAARNRRGADCAARK